MQFCVTADDFGLDQEVNAGIVELARHGRISAVSVMLHADAALEGLEDLARTGVAIGIHLVLVEERPLTGGPLLRPALDADGRLPARWSELMTLLLRRPWLARGLRQEAEAQIARFLSLGIPLRFINSHQHVHQFPPLWLALAPVFSRHPHAWIRCAHHWGRSGGKQLMVAASATLSRLLRRVPNRLLYPVGINHAGQLSEAALLALLADVQRQAASDKVELVTHPGHQPYNPGGPHAQWGYAWRQEYDALMSPAFGTALLARQLELGFPL